MMKTPTRIKACVAIICIASSLFFSSFNSVYAKPFWLKEGICVKYSMGKNYVIRRIIVHENATEQQILMIILNASYSWSILNIGENLAEVEVNFTGWIKFFTKFPEFRIVEVNRTIRINLNVDTGDTVSNGEDLGKVPWWLTNLERGIIVTIGRRPYQVNGTVIQLDSEYVIETPLMKFNGGWAVWFNGTDFSHWFMLHFDKKHGLLLSCLDGYFDPVLSHILISIASDLGIQPSLGRPPAVSLSESGKEGGIVISSVKGIKFEESEQSSYVDLSKIIPILLITTAFALPLISIIKRRRPKSFRKTHQSTKHRS